ncbi:hypothetical protein [Halalkalibacter oceani]|uniref:hypothetical protein n=1 Tax=Halalkalibacter oceani TaxID=1653776 RepID=UPI00339B74DE
MKVKIKLENTTSNQEIARQIRDANERAHNPVSISFNETLSEIYFEGEYISIPEADWFSDDMLLEGQVKQSEAGLEIHPKDKGKTVNIHFDADLVAELNEIKQHVRNKTQHEIVLELFRKGLDQYNKEKDQNKPSD